MSAPEAAAVVAPLDLQDDERRHGFAEVPRFGPYVASATSVSMQRELAPGFPSR